MYARFYLLLLKADPKAAEIAINSKEPKAKTTKTPEKNKAPLATPTTSQQQDIVSPNSTVVDPVPTPIAPRILNNSPELHINIQLHISPESSTEQIDKIFESMSKHLKDFNK